MTEMLFKGCPFLIDINSFPWNILAKSDWYGTPSRFDENPKKNPLSKKDQKMTSKMSAIFVSVFLFSHW